MPSLNYLALAAFAAGLILTLVLAAWLTPASWWRRPNARALAILAGGTWALGSLLLGFAQVPPVTRGAAPPAALQGLANAGGALAKGDYRTHRSLNVRSATGTGAQRLAVLPAGALVSTTGVREGDWWQVTAKIDGKPVSGWASSLWLRRADEAGRQASTRPAAAASRP